MTMNISHLRNIFALKNRHILITGASRGLGSVSARAFSEQGSILALMARSKDDLEDVRRSCKSPEKHLSIPADLTDMDALNNSIVKAKEFLGELDVVLHVAGGGLGFREPLIKQDDLLKIFSLNVGVAAEINRLVVPDMRKRKKGNLVHVASIASIEATGSVGYNTSKAALAAYVRTLGNELMSYGIVVTGILPGGFSAPGNAMERLKANKPEVLKKFIEDRLPRKRMAMSDELIPLLLFLCSEAASMMGGCLVPIDAGEGKSYLRT